MSSVEALEGVLGRLESSLFADALRSHAILDDLPAAIYTTDTEGRITFCNRAAKELFGREPELGTDKWCGSWRLYRADGTPLPHDECPMATTLKEKRPTHGMEVVVERPDGTRVAVTPYPTPIFDASGVVIGAVNMVLDITERKQAEAALRAQQRAERDQQLLVSIIESSDDAIISKDLNGVIMSWNRGAERLFGYSADEIIGKPVTTLMHADHQDEEPGILARIRRGERIEHYETIRRRKDGSPVDISLTVSPVRNAEGRVIGASKIARDIGARKRAEEAVIRRGEEQAALYRFTDALQHAKSPERVCDAALDTIIEALRCQRAAILKFDKAGVMRFVAWRNLSEDYRQSVEGHSPWTLDTQEPQPICVDDVEHADLGEALTQTVKAEGIGALAFIPLLANGRLIGKFMAYYDQPHAFASTEIDLALTIARQLGFSIEQARAERARSMAEMTLRESEERFRILADSAPALIWVNGLDGCEYVNRGYLEFLGVPELRGYDWAQYIHPEERGRLVEAYQQALAHQELFNGEFRFRRHDGEYRWMRSVGHPRIGAGGELLGYAGVTIDIHERKQIESQRDLLVAELSHRVKNTLATVISIARQSFTNGVPVEDARRSFDGRIRALAQTHGRLAEENWSGISFETMLLDELAPYRREDGGNVQVSGPSIFLNPKWAVVLGMTFHELATNAVKYGALSTRNGLVDVSWEVTSPDQKFLIRWTESGGPLVAPPQRSGFGRLLLERALASDLQGNVQLDFAESGLRCEIVLPFDEHAAHIN